MFEKSSRKKICFPCYLVFFANHYVNTHVLYLRERLSVTTEASKILQKVEGDFRNPVKNTCLVEGEYLCTNIAGRDCEVEQKKWREKERE